jgi:RNA polymerase sigma-70 factor, ECF subfamily
MNMFFKKRVKYNQDNDNELIKKFVVEKNNEIIGEIYERYSYLVMGVCLKYLKDEDDAKDICSKIFEELGNKIERYEIQNFKSWFYQLVKNECLMFIRKNKYFFLSTENLSNLEEQDENKQENEERILLLEKAICKLKSEQANAIKLFYLEEKSYSEISKILAIDINSVKSYIQNGKRNLKNILIQNQEFKQ